MNKRKKQILTSFDVETAGFDGLKPYMKPNIFSYCIGQFLYDDNGNISGCKVDVRRLDGTPQEIEANWKHLKEYWKNNNIVKIIHNAKYELHMLKRHKIYIPKKTIIHDTMIMHQCLRNLAPGHSLDYIAWELCNYTRDLDVLTKKLFKSGISYDKMDKKMMTQYQVYDGERPLIIYNTLMPYLKKDKRMYQDYLMEIECVKATQIEESNGLHLHKKNIEDLKIWLKDEIKKINIKVFEILGEYVNLNSDDTLRRLLFGKYKYDPIGVTKTGKPSVDKDTLFEIQRLHPHNELVNCIFKYRTYNKVGLSTIKKYEELQYKGYIYPNFRSNGAKTSRKRSSKPNLQNVSKDAALKNPFPVALRKCFGPPPGFVWIPVDFAGIEMRVMINNTREPFLFNGLMDDPELDTHTPTLECFMMDGYFKYEGDAIYQSGIDLTAKLKKEDKKAFKVKRGGIKNTGFGVAYGAGPDTISITMGQPVKDIMLGLTNYKKRFSRIANYSKVKIKEVLEKGYITTSFGKRLYVPKNKPYVGSNYDIQGTAAGVLKRGQIGIQNLLTWKKCYKNITILLDIHDELILQFPINLMPYKDEILNVFHNELIDVPEIEVPLRAEFQICTDSWNEKEDLPIPFVDLRNIKVI